MKYALITEGETEYASLPLLYDEIRARTGHQILRPLVAHITPLASVERIARECKPLFAVAAARRVDRVIVLLDHEGRADCPGVLASALKAAIAGVCGPSLPFDVVYKVATIENWFIADLGALRAQPKRYQVPKALERRIEPDKADSVDALGALESACLGGYDKTEDGPKLAARLSVGAAARHSRSLRHLLHVLADPAYATQCRQPESPGSQRGLPPGRR